MPLHPVAGYERKGYTLWEGKFGMLISNTQVGGSSNVMTMAFTADDCTMDVIPGVGIYTMQTTVFNGRAHIEGITDMTIEGAANNDTVVVPTGTNTVSYNITPGVYYDQYGAEWPIQGLEFKALPSIHSVIAINTHLLLPCRK